MRYIYDHILQDLARKMVFIGGPRQVGKTTLARAVVNPPKATQIVARLQHPYSRGNLQIMDPVTYFRGPLSASY